MIRAALALCLACVGAAGNASPPADAAMAALGPRLFPVLTGLDRSRASAPVRDMLAQRARRDGACHADAACRIDGAKWTEPETALLVTEAGRMRGAGGLLADPAELAAAVRREVAGLNAILAVYGQGAAARYPEIDGPVARPGEPRFATSIAVAAALADAGRQDPVAAFDPSLGLALALLDVNDRLDASAFEPLDGGMNAAAFARASTIDWARYRYGAMIVLGVGPDDLATPLSAPGKLNVRNAANRFAQGDVAFIIVSGGFAHPRGTRFAEAVEMRKALIERYGVPADAIVIDPHARHTTTNLRNAARLMMRLRVPAGRDAIVITNPQHSAYVEGPEFAARNQRELGYEPGRIGQRNSPIELVFRPSPLSARIDPLDPLDP